MILLMRLGYITVGYALLGLQHLDSAWQAIGWKHSACNVKSRPVYEFELQRGAVTV